MGRYPDPLDVHGAGRGPRGKTVPRRPMRRERRCGTRGGRSCSAHVREVMVEQQRSGSTVQRVPALGSSEGDGDHPRRKRRGVHRLCHRSKERQVAAKVRAHRRPELPGRVAGGGPPRPVRAPAAREEASGCTTSTSPGEARRTSWPASAGARSRTRRPLLTLCPRGNRAVLRRKERELGVHENHGRAGGPERVSPRGS